MAIIGNINIKWNEAGLNKIMAEGEDFIDKVADDVLENAKTIVPVDTGKLRDSLKIKDGDNKYERLVGTDTTTYALHVEFGTINTPIQAYLRPAMDEVISKL
jgi:HK97 gp10 family phage protein